MNLDVGVMPNSKISVVRWAATAMVGLAAQLGKQACLVFSDGSEIQFHDQIVDLVGFAELYEVHFR